MGRCQLDHNPLGALAKHQPSLAGAPSPWGQILTHLGSLENGGEAEREEPESENHRPRPQGKGTESSCIPFPSPCQPSQIESSPFRNDPPTSKTPAHEEDLDLAQALTRVSPEGTPGSCLWEAA